MAKYIGQDVAVTYEGAVIGALTGTDVSIDGTSIDISDRDIAEFTQHLPGRKNSTMSFSFNFDDTDTSGQVAVLDDMLAGNKGEFVWGRPSPSTGQITLTGTGFVTSYSISGSDEEVINVSVEVQISGTLTKTTAV